MDEQNAKKKELKRAYKKAKRKTVLPWKIAAIILAVLTVIATPLNIVLHMFDNTVAAFVGGTFWELENPDPHAEYFHGDFATVEEMIDYGLDVCRRVVQSYADAAFGELPLSGQDHEIILRFYKCACFGQIMEWLNTGMRYDLRAQFRRLCELADGMIETMVRRASESA